MTESERVYLVERMVDAGSVLALHARHVIDKVYPGSELIGGAGYYRDGGDFERRYEGEVSTVDVVVTTRRTLGLGGTKEVEHAMAEGIPVYTVHGRKLQPITHLWYAEDACVYDPKTGRSCLHPAFPRHHARMHNDPNRVAETRAAPIPDYALNRTAGIAL